MPDESEAQRKAAREREALEEWLRTNRAETARRDLADAAPQTDRGTATYTQIEAIDRAAHTPAVHADLRASRTPAFSRDEEMRLAERDRDYAELYPTPDAWERSFPVLSPPDDSQERAQYDDLARFQKEADKVTPEQKSRVDQALAEVNLSDKIGASADVSARPRPSEPEPVEKARDIGKDLQKSGVEMDK